MSSKTISAILWTLVSVNVITLVVGGLVTWLGYSIPVRLKQLGLLPELVITAGLASLVVACIGLGALNYSSYHALNLYGVLCTLFALLLIFGIPENWYKSNQFVHTLLLDIIYFVLLFILLVLLGFAFTFAHYLRKKELEIELFESGNNHQVDLNLRIDQRTDLPQQSIYASENNSNEQQHQGNANTSANCTCNSHNFLPKATDNTNNPNSGNNCTTSSAGGASADTQDRTNIHQLFQSNKTGQAGKGSNVALSNQHHAYNNYHLSNFRTSNFASNTFDSRKLSTTASRRNTQLANLALSTSNLSYQQQLQLQLQQQQQQPIVISEIGNTFQDDDRQLLLDSCSFLATQELVHKGYYQRDGRRVDSTPPLIRTKSCTRMPHGFIDDDVDIDRADDDDDKYDVGVGINGFADDDEIQDYDDGHGDNCCDRGDICVRNDLSGAHIELKDLRTYKNLLEDHQRYPLLGEDPLLNQEIPADCTLSELNNTNLDKTRQVTRQRPRNTLNLLPINYYGSSKDDSHIHYTNPGKRKQLIEEKSCCTQVRHRNRLHQHYHHYHQNHKHQHQHQLYTEHQKHSHKINPQIHSQSNSHPRSYASNQTQLTFPFPSHLYQSTTMARQTACRCNQLLKTPASASNVSNATSTTATPAAANTATTVEALTTTVGKTSASTFIPPKTFEQGLSSVNSNQSIHLKANRSSPYTMPILPNNSSNSFAIKTNKPKSDPRSNEGCVSPSSVMAPTAKETVIASTALLGSLSDPSSSCSQITTTKSSGNGMVDDCHSFGGKNSIYLDHSNNHMMDNYQPDFDNIIANDSMDKDTTSTSNHRHKLDPSLLM